MTPKETYRKRVEKLREIVEGTGSEILGNEGLKRCFWTRSELLETC